MTDRFHTLTVVLDRDVREDDCASLINAIHHMRGVVSVNGVVADMESHMAEERAKHDLRRRLFEVLK
jgi:hypothetical protein